MNKLVLTFQEIKGRLTGFSIPIFGLSWQPDEPEIKIAKRIITTLEDRRVLYSPYVLEVPKHCINSVLEIRKLLSDEIGKISQQKELYNDIQLLRAACRKFLNYIQEYEKDLDEFPNSSMLSGFVFFTSLGEMRGVFGFVISKIAISYGINITGDLVNIIPINKTD
ncbi:MAG: hypothetical protein KKD31_16370 [Bacteroidetes bacterium]|nr:hypothetical protein [Bacteroidota bacterium]